MKKRIYGFTLMNCKGEKVTMYERDFNSRTAFMKERRRFKNQGMKVTDLITTTPEKKPVAKPAAKRTTGRKTATKKKTTTKKATAKKPAAKKKTSSKSKKR